jgi:hypothetical protein
MGIVSNISKLEAESLRIKEGINNLLLSMPDNPDIKRIGNGPRCFSINFSSIRKDAGLNLSPYYYDWQYQYEKLILKVNATNITHLVVVIENAIKNKHFVHDNEKVILHPEVIKQLKSLL